MDYRVLPRRRRKDQCDRHGFLVIGAQPEKEIVRTVRAAVDHGINYFDMAGGHAAIFEAYGKALRGFVAGCTCKSTLARDYTTGAYGWTTDLAQNSKIRRMAAPKAWHGLH